MNKQIFKLYFWILGITVFLIGCNGFTLQPGFITVLGGKGEQVKILEATQTTDNSIVLSLSQPIKEFESRVFYTDSELDVNGEPTSEIAHELQQISNANLSDNDNSESQIKYKCTIFDEIEIGKEFTLAGKIKAKNNITLEFSFLFKGQNHSPAVLEISEYKPIYSKSLKVPIPEFIELIVKESGNLSGLKIMSVGSSKTTDYLFPAAEVEAGEIIVVHLRYFEEESDLIQDETTPAITSGGNFACSNARDFWAKFEKPPAQRKTNIVLVQTPVDSIQDCLAYVNSKNIGSDGTPEWSEEQKTIIKKVINTDFQNMITTPVKQNITASVSLSKFKTGIIWRLCGKKGQPPITIGQAN